VGDNDDIDEAALEKEVEKEGLDMLLDDEIKVLVDIIDNGER
jgi:hypothetical protein